MLNIQYLKAKYGEKKLCSFTNLRANGDFSNLKSMAMDEQKEAKKGNEEWKREEYKKSSFSLWLMF